MYAVYILKSLKCRRYYVGCTKDLVQRLNLHNSKKVTSTKVYSPWEVIYTEYFELKSEAFIREKQIKSYKCGVAFKKLIK